MHFHTRASLSHIQSKAFFAKFGKLITYKNELCNANRMP